jgi:hypothetical protein
MITRVNTFGFIVFSASFGWICMSFALGETLMCKKLKLLGFGLLMMKIFLLPAAATKDEIGELRFSLVAAMFVGNPFVLSFFFSSANLHKLLVTTILFAGKLITRPKLCA